MPYRAKANPTRKVYKKTNSVGFSKAVKAIVHKEAETKSALSNVTPGFIFDDFCYAQNLNFFIQQGQTSEQLIGEKLFLKNIHLKGWLSSVNNATASNEPLMYRLLLIRSKKPLITTSGTITATDVFRSTVDLSSNAHVDMHKVDIIRDIRGKIPMPRLANTTDSIAFDLNVKINKSHTFDSDNSGYFKDKNYYLVYTAYKVSHPASNVGFLKMSYTLNYKDM